MTRDELAALVRQAVTEHWAGERWDSFIANLHAGQEALDRELQAELDAGLKTEIKKRKAKS